MLDIPTPAGQRATQTVTTTLPLAILERNIMRTQFKTSKMPFWIALMVAIMVLGTVVVIIYVA